MMFLNYLKRYFRKDLKIRTKPMNHYKQIIMLLIILINIASLIIIITHFRRIITNDRKTRSYNSVNELSDE
jgi:cell division protein FtsL